MSSLALRVQRQIGDMTAHGLSFKNIRQWRGSQDQAFEELCYQLRDPTPDGADLIKTGSPDGGLEWYVRLRNGEQWGWQAKYTFDTDILLKLMEKSLKTVAKKRPKCRRLTFCIPYDLPDAPEDGKRKSARQKFEDRKISWRKRIPGADRICIDLWSEGELLERIVRHPAQRGIEWFFWNNEVFSPDWAAQRLSVAVQAAGERYTPELHVEVPVTFALEGLALSGTYWRRYETLRGAVVKAANQIKTSRYTDIGRTKQLQVLGRLLKTWRREVPSCVGLPRRLDRHTLLCLTKECRDAAYAAHPLTPPRRTRGLESAKVFDDQRSWLRYELRQLVSALQDFESLLESSATEAASLGALVLSGEAGQGKTHLFCDVVQRTVSAGRPAAVLFGGRFSGRSVWSDIAGQLGLGNIGSEQLIGGMQVAAEASDAPFLLLIDALNDAAEPSAWQEELPALLAETAQSPWISIGVSVRSSYRPVVFPADGLSGVAEVEHRGFEGRELEAVEKFFDFYGLEQPRVPLLMPEFVNPLFLKLYCESLKGLGLSAPEVGAVHVSDIFQWYVELKSKRIVSRLKLDPATSPVQSAVDSLSRELANQNSESLPRDVGAQIVNEYAPGLHSWPDTMLGALLSEGVLTADIAWDGTSGQFVQVVRFTYQRFGDYRVGSVFLRPLNGNLARLREALATDKPLHVQLSEAPAGWIEALAVLIPEGFNVELLDAAQWQLDSRARFVWDRAFVRSISARRPDAVTKRSRVLLSQVGSRTRELSELVLEILLEVAPSPQHPLNANTLHEILMCRSMATRDATWGTYTYFAFDDGGAIDRLIRWSARGPHHGYPDDVVELAAIPLIWTFTSPSRRMRDYATKSLARLLSGSLSVLPALIRRFEGVNDPYVMERLAVASHGAVLCGGRAAPQVAAATAQELRRVALDELQVPNIITRDAVRGIHEWCFHHDLISEETYRAVLPPYGSDPPGRPRSLKELRRTYDKEKIANEDVSWPYGDLFNSIFGLGDFGNYVIEPKLRRFSHHLLSSAAQPQHDWRTTFPVDFGRRWVLERVLSLGWTPGALSEFDRYYVRDQGSRSEHKAERFGKKYQWIALRELVARIADNYHMTDDFSDQPMSYAGPWQFFGRDIDPTLPPPSRERNEDDEVTLGSTFGSDDEAWWIPEGPTYHRDDPPVGEGWAVESEGIPEFEPLVRRMDDDGTRWVVLHAYYHWNDEAKEQEKWQDRRRRDQWSHIYSWLVQPKDRDTLVEYLKKNSLMGRWMPEGREHVDSALLGELPWAVAANEYPDSWSEIRPLHGLTPIEINVYPTWSEYLWEGNVLDCSIDDGVRAMFPAPTLFEIGGLKWIPGTRTWCESDGTLVARYHEGLGHSALLVRENWLMTVVQKAGNCVVLGLLGEKQLFEAGAGAGLAGDWTRINGVASIVGAEWTFHNRRLERRSVSR